MTISAVRTVAPAAAKLESRVSRGRVVTLYVADRVDGGRIVAGRIVAVWRWSRWHRDLVPYNRRYRDRFSPDWSRPIADRAWRARRRSLVVRVLATTVVPVRVLGAVLISTTLRRASVRAVRADAEGEGECA